MNNDIGKYLEHIRKEKGYSLRKAEELTGISFSYIRDLELGINRKTNKELTPSVPTLKKIADAYQIDYYDLLIKADIINQGEVADAISKVDRLLLKETKLDYTAEKNSIPLIGTVCAGEGMLAQQNIDEYVQYPFPGKKQPDYALRVKGDSMSDAGIEHGDIVYLRHAQWADHNGQIVAVLVNDSEDGMLKRIKWTEGSPRIQLVPENPNYDTIEVLPNEIEICGIYMGHFKPVKEEL